MAGPESRPREPSRPDEAHLHYFTEQPVRSDTTRELTVRLRGRDVHVITSSGVFSGARLDPGTEVLLREVPPPPQGGDLLDLGCGWGPVALSLALAAPHATVWAVDVTERARDLTRRNAERLGLAGVRVCEPARVPTDTMFAAIWSNPPIRIGKAGLHGLLLHWLPRLSPGASAWLVVQRNLGADSLQAWLQHVLADSATVEREASSRGYRVLRVHATAQSRGTAEGGAAGA